MADQVGNRWTIVKGFLSSKVVELKAVPPSLATKLADIGINTFADLLTHYPRRYEDRSSSSAFPTESTESKVAFCGVIRDMSPRFFGRTRMFEMSVCGDPENPLSGQLTCRWFNMNYLAKQFKVGQRVALYGKVKLAGKRLVIDHPEYEVIQDEEEQAQGLQVGAITPVYSLGKGVSQRVLRRAIYELLNRLRSEGGKQQIIDLLPASSKTVQESQLSREQALYEVHFPTSLEKKDSSRAYLALEELLGLQLGILQKRQAMAKNPRPLAGIEGNLWEEFRTTLPFSLTAAQERVVSEIKEDMKSSTQMSRLLQGDVGSGKTVVAVAAILYALEAGKTAALMAPTQILAEQHYLLLKRWLEPLQLRIALRTSNRQEESFLPLLDGGDIPQIWVGTHALLFDKAGIDPPDLVIIDEQHKFGVEQRAALIARGNRPDLLVMTATPIPRTLTLTLYGDLEVSVLDEAPANRGEIVTALRKKPAIRDVTKFFKEQIAKGRQIYIVYPLVEDSDSLKAASVESEFVKWKKRMLPHQVGMIHGRLSPEEKESMMASFRSEKIEVLVGTSVIEVGIDVPNASVMVIYNAERFGLSQLHQLRGRIGRGEHKSYCILVSESKDEESLQKLKILEAHRDGFRIAEEDLKLRGPGELLGVQQSGLSGLKLGDLLSDVRLVKEAREIAKNILADDPTLENEKHQLLHGLIPSQYAESADVVVS